MQQSPTVKIGGCPVRGLVELGILANTLRRAGNTQLVLPGRHAALRSSWPTVSQYGCLRTAIESPSTVSRVALAPGTWPRPLLDAVRVSNKYLLNPLMGTLAGRKNGYAAAIRHTGRKS